MELNSKRAEEQSLKKNRINILLVFVTMVVLVTIILAFMILERSSYAIRKNAMELIAANSSQLQINIDTYFAKVEQISALMFSDEAYYKYDETDPSIDEYTKLQFENGISDRIVDIGIMENFSDFGVIYSDDYAKGWISNNTKLMFSENMYDTFVSQITNEKTSSGWFFADSDDYDRLYYVKKLNDNAVLVTSIYSRELANVFNLSEQFDGMKIRLVDDSYRILYSSDKEESGSYLPGAISSVIGDSRQLSISDEEYLINVDTCGNGWRVVCTVSTADILSDISELRNYTTFITAFLIVAVIVVGVLSFGRLTRPIDKLVSDLETKAATDGLTGLYNKKAFEEIVTRDLMTLQKGSSISFTIIDMDHFKNINDTEGHAYGDRVIVKTAEFLKRNLPKNTCIGRIGGDEFAFYFKDKSKTLEVMEKDTESILGGIKEQFATEFKDEHEKYNASISMGSYVKSFEGEGFDTIYYGADKALYISKQTGRDRYTFYQEKKDSEE